MIDIGVEYTPVGLVSAAVLCVRGAEFRTKQEWRYQTLTTLIKSYELCYMPQEVSTISSELCRLSYRIINQAPPSSSTSARRLHWPTQSLFHSLKDHSSSPTSVSVTVASQSTTAGKALLVCVFSAHAPSCCGRVSVPRRPSAWSPTVGAWSPTVGFTC